MLRSKGCTAEGIFRKNGNIRLLKEACARINSNPSALNLEQDNPIQLAALMKKFFREMPDPLLTFKLSELFLIAASRLCFDIELPNQEQKVAAIHLLCCMLPKCNIDLLSALSLFIGEVAEHSNQNMMTIANLATVMAPNILYNKDNSTPSDAIYAIEVIDIIFTHHKGMLIVIDSYIAACRL